MVTGRGRGSKCSVPVGNAALQVKQHLQRVFSGRKSSNHMAVSMALGLRPWVAGLEDSQYLAGKRAIETGGTDDISSCPFPRDGGLAPGVGQEAEQSVRTWVSAILSVSALPSVP